jgi:hypothetical protein
MKTTQRGLTRREQEYLDHLQRARTQKVTLADYCRARGIDAQSLYRVSARLARKGYLDHRSEMAVAAPEAEPFVAVRVAAVATGGDSAVCRLRHPSGWTIECSHWPQASWMTALVAGGEHVAS